MQLSVSLPTPNGIFPSRVKPSQNSRLVAITSVLSTSLVVPGFRKGSKIKRESVSLGDFGTPPFTIVLPLKMLKHHVDSNLVRIFSDNTADSATTLSSPQSTAFAVTTNTEPTRAAQSLNPLIHCDLLHFSETDDQLCDDTHVGSNAREGQEEGKPGVTEDDENTSSITSEALELVALAGLVGNQAVEQGGRQDGRHIMLPCKHLDEPPTTTISDVFSAWLGDTYHAMR